MKKLNACPFCGNEKPQYTENHHAEVTRKQDGTLGVDCRFTTYQIVCGVCGAKTKEFDVAEEAINRWNGRA